MKQALPIVAIASLSCSLLYPVDELRNGAPEEPNAREPTGEPTAVVGPLSTAIVLVTRGGDGPDPQSVRERVFGETSRFLSEASYGRAWLEGEVLGPVALEVGPCALGDLAEQADEALARSGFQVSRYRHAIYLHHDLGCPSAIAWDEEKRRGWIREGLSAAAWGHLYGHLLGLDHAKSCECGGAALQPLTECALNDSFNLFDVMGVGTEDPPVERYQWGHPNLASKQLLGWIDRDGAPVTREVSEPGIYSIEALETQTSGVKGLRVLRSAEPEQWFYVELRRPIGFDGSSEAVREWGVLVHLVREIGPALLDAKPQSEIGPRDWIDAALGPGESVVDGVSGTVIAVREVGAEEASIEISRQTPTPGAGGAPLTEQLFAWPSNVRPGETIAIEFDASKVRSSEDWIGMYRLDSYRENPEWVGPTQGRPSGTLLAEAPNEAGSYEFRYYRGSEGPPIARSNPISISR